jgi:hypothetical protein
VTRSPGTITGIPGGYGVICSAAMRPVAVAGADCFLCGEERVAGQHRRFEFEFVCARQVDPCRAGQAGSGAGQRGERRQEPGGGLVVIGQRHCGFYSAMVAESHVDALMLTQPVGRVVAADVQAGYVDDDV